MRLKVIDYDVMRVAFDEKFKQTYQLIQNGETHLDNLAEGFREADDVIFALPTIEAEPVKHGRWIFDVCNHREHMKCSECLHSYEPTGVFTYCPNCGAKMDAAAGTSGDGLGQPARGVG